MIEDFTQMCNKWLMEMTAKYNAPLDSMNFVYNRAILVAKMRNEFVAGIDCFEKAEPIFKRLCESANGDVVKISNDDFYGRNINDD